MLQYTNVTPFNISSNVQFEPLHQSHKILLQNVDKLNLITMHAFLSLANMMLCTLFGKCSQVDFT